MLMSLTPFSALFPNSLSVAQLSPLPLRAIISLWQGSLLPRPRSTIKHQPRLGACHIKNV